MYKDICARMHKRSIKEACTPSKIPRCNQIVPSGSRHLSLAYALHKPPDQIEVTDRTPMVLLHGLFGSKQNNRSFSK